MTTLLTSQRPVHVRCTVRNGAVVWEATDNNQPSNASRQSFKPFGQWRLEAGKAYQFIVTTDIPNRMRGVVRGAADTVGREAVYGTIFSQTPAERLGVIEVMTQAGKNIEFSKWDLISDDPKIKIGTTNNANQWKHTGTASSSSAASWEYSTDGSTWVQYTAGEWVDVEVTEDLVVSIDQEDTTYYCAIYYYSGGGTSRLFAQKPVTLEEPAVFSGLERGEFQLNLFEEEQSSAQSLAVE